MMATIDARYEIRAERRQRKKLIRAYFQNAAYQEVK